jgi:exodeoxyribonuclease-3
LKIASWNVNSIRARLDHVLEWLDREAPDILALQETKVQDADFPVDELSKAGYHCLYSGQKSYNGVAVLSRQPLDEAPVTQLDDFEDPQQRVLGVALPAAYLLNLYVPNGASVDSEKYHYKLAWLDALYEHCRALLSRHSRLLVVGDFNIAPEDRDVHDPTVWKGKVLVSPPERERLQKLFSLGLLDTFRSFEQAPDTFSWWDYRGGGFRRNLGLRIDLILASSEFGAYCRSSRIDVTPRRKPKPSDHAPVIAEFAV